MKTTFQARKTVAALSVAAAVTAGCAATGGLDDSSGSTSTPTPSVTSPASERVIAGIAELVLTSRIWPTFEEARLDPVTELADGSPLYAYIRATRPLGELAHPPTPGGNYAFSEYPHLFLQVGDVDSLRILGTCYITLTGEEASMRELVVPLAPLTFRPGQIPADCWLSTVVAGRSGKRTFEVRLAGFAGKFESWLPVPDLLAVAPVPTDLSNGAGDYATMLRATPLRSATLVASTSSVASSAAPAPAYNPAALSPVAPASSTPSSRSAAFPASTGVPASTASTASTPSTAPLASRAAEPAPPPPRATPQEPVPAPYAPGAAPRTGLESILLTAPPRPEPVVLPTVSDPVILTPVPDPSVLSAPRAAPSPAPAPMAPAAVTPASYTSSALSPAAPAASPAPVAVAPQPRNPALQPMPLPAPSPANFSPGAYYSPVAPEPPSLATVAPTLSPPANRRPALVAASGAPLPGPRQDIGNSRMELQLQSLTAGRLGRRPSEAFFVDNQWTSAADPRGRVWQQHAHAAVIFKGASCSWQRLKAFRRPGASGLLDIEPAGEPIEVNCSDLR